MADLNKYLGKDVSLTGQRELVREASDEELDELITDLQREVFEQRTSALMQQLSNPMRIRAARKLVARAQTEITARASGKGEA